MMTLPRNQNVPFFGELVKSLRETETPPNPVPHNLGRLALSSHYHLAPLHSLSRGDRPTLGPLSSLATAPRVGPAIAGASTEVSSLGYFSSSLVHPQVSHSPSLLSATSLRPTTSSPPIYPSPAAFASPGASQSPGLGLASLSPIGTALPGTTRLSPQSRLLFVLDDRLKKEAQSEQKEEPVLPRKKHTCQICLRAFTTLGHLARHNRTHTGERNHHCPFETCTARFARQDNCMQHYKTHLEAKSRPKRGRPAIKAVAKR